MPSQEVSFPFPIRGLTKNRAYQEGDTQTTRDAINVIPSDYDESRVRGGTRQGLAKRYTAKTDARPTFVVRVSGGDSTEIYEFLIIGTPGNIYKGESVANGTEPPISYSETLNALSGELATEDGDTLITEVASNTIIIDDFNVTGIDPEVVTQYGDSVIIGSDGEVLFSGTDGDINPSGQFDDDAGTDWTDPNGDGISVDPEQHYLEITADAATTAEVYLGTFAIGSVSSTVITLTADPRLDTSQATTTGKLTYQIVNAVRDLNPNTPSIATLSPVGTGGFIPTNADAVISYRDRLVFATARLWEMSRQGDPGDFDYAADPEDPTHAIAGTTGGPGQPEDPIITMATGGFDYLILFSESSTWVMRGDPGYGGQLYQLSDTIGCVGRNAWCHGDGQEIYFLAKEGLYVIGSGAREPQQISPERLPKELRGLDQGNYHLTLVYEPDDDIVLIFVFPKQGTGGTHYAYHIETDSFWPIKLMDNSFQPVDGVTFGGNPAVSRRATLVCVDGYVRNWQGSKDDGKNITSHVVFGPYLASKESAIDGIIQELNATLDSDGASATLEVYVGSSAEAASEAAITATNPAFSASIGPGRTYTKRPRIRGVAFCIRISASAAWAFEGLTGMISTGGKVRRI